MENDKEAEEEEEESARAAEMRVATRKTKWSTAEYVFAKLSNTQLTIIFLAIILAYTAIEVGKLIMLSGAK